jgi:hypothetical protein
VTLEGKAAPKGSVSLLRPLLKEGKLARNFEALEKIRSRVLGSLKELKAAEPSLAWR